MPPHLKTQTDGGSLRLSPAARAERIREVSLWLAHLERAARNCLLYGPKNEAIVRIRAQLTGSLILLLERFDPLVIHFTAGTALVDDDELLLDQSVREGLIALLHRDGIRSLTLRFGVEPAEVDALLEAIVRCSGPSSGDSDLVTMLWEADLQHVEIVAMLEEANFVPYLEGEESDSSFLPWPACGEDEDPGRLDSASAEVADSPAAQVRADDWVTAAAFGTGAAAFADDTVTPEVERLRSAHEREGNRSLLDAAVEVAKVCLTAATDGEVAEEFRRFLIRVLRQAVQVGDWKVATDALPLLLKGPGSARVELGAVGRMILESVSVAELIQNLDRQDPESARRFIVWARALGDAAPDWIFHAMAESEERRNRRLFAQTLAEICRTRPDRLSLWMADTRWYVVRNLVFVLGQIGGDAIGPLLRQAAEHREYRVRRQCLAALGTMSLPAARPILLHLLREPESELLRGALSLLVTQKDTVAARGILSSLLAADSAHRPEADRLALAAAVAAAGGDEILPHVEQLLGGENWVTRHAATCLVLASAIAKSATPATIEFLHKGVGSRHATVRAACAAALGSVEHAG